MTRSLQTGGVSSDPRESRLSRVKTLSIIALAATTLAVPALAQKANGKSAESKPRSGPYEPPPGLMVAAQHAAEGAGHGHGDDVPRGNGHGWGHQHHDHQPVSP